MALLQEDEIGKLRSSSSSIASTTTTLRRRSTCRIHDYKLTGNILICAWYINGTLYVRIKRVEHLPMIGNQLPNPYVKVYVSDNYSKGPKARTSVKTNTCDPEYNEELMIPVPYEGIEYKTIWVSVWNETITTAKFRKKTLVGEVRIPLVDLTLARVDKWYKLKDKDKSAMTDPVLGFLTVGLFYELSDSINGENYGKLHVYIKNAKELPKDKKSGASFYLGKVKLLHTCLANTKPKTTKMIKNNTNPAWNEHFVFPNLKGAKLLHNNAVEITVWEQVESKIKIIGRVFLGPFPKQGEDNEWMDPMVGENRHYIRSVMYRRYYEYCHRLRPPTEDSYRRSADSIFDQIIIDESKFIEKENFLEGGELTLSLCYEPYGPLRQNALGRLNVRIKKIRQLLNFQTSWYDYIFVSVALLPMINRSEESIKQTEMAKNDAVVKWDETLSFDNVKLTHLFTDHVLEIIVWGQTQTKSDEFIGGIRIGYNPEEEQSNEWMDSYPKEVAHWDNMISYFGEWVDQTHDLNSIMQIFAKQPEDSQGYTRGQLTVLISLDVVSKSIGNIYLHIREAKELHHYAKNGVYAEIRIISNDPIGWEIKNTKVIRDTENPFWNQGFAFSDICKESLESIVVVDISLWGHNDGEKLFFGRLRLGPDPKLTNGSIPWIDSTPNEVTHWTNMLRQPGELILATHYLRQ